MSRIAIIYFMLIYLLLADFVYLFPKVYPTRTTKKAECDNQVIIAEIRKLIPEILQAENTKTTTTTLATTTTTTTTTTTATTTTTTTTTTPKPTCKPNMRGKDFYDEHFNCIMDCRCAGTMYKDCTEAAASNQLNSDVFLLNHNYQNLAPFYTFCEVEDSEQTKPWTLIQRRQDGSVDFQRNWEDYKHGFGDLFGEFWLGLERIHLLTKYANYELWIVLNDYYDTKVDLRYSVFAVSEESSRYKLSIGGYSGEVVDCMEYHNGREFATYDHTRDEVHKNCPVHYQGGWWFKFCANSNLNGPYFKYANSNTTSGILWRGWWFPASFKYTHMAIREV